MNIAHIGYLIKEKYPSISIDHQIEKAKVKDMWSCGN
jgi:hypothetical protein